MLKTDDIITKVLMLSLFIIILLQIIGVIIGKDFQINLLLFVAILVGGLLLLYKMVVTVGPEKKLEKEDWIVIGLSLIIIVAVLFIFRGLIPPQFMSAVNQLKSIIGVP